MNPNLEILPFFDEATNTASYLVIDKATNTAAIIDPVLDYYQRSGKASVDSVNKMLSMARKKEATIDWVLETHVHADHLSAACVVKRESGARVGIGEHVRDVQKIFRAVFNAQDVSASGAEFDHLFKDSERFNIGSLEVEVIHTPGHTPACVAYKIDDAIFVGDTLFMPDYGTARADFPGGDARTLFRSIKRLLALPPETRIFVGHDYKAPGRDRFAWETTVGEERTSNPHVRDGISEDEFVAKREARDATLSPPLLLLPSIQANMRAGGLPPAEENGVRYFRIPVTLTSEGAKHG
ncbi:MBL fold metallo-hydrolase [Rhodoblastus sp.]|uniref:MBL fold metallo-hydrolase n=1 Tax=Rhodoblastus sp. TaxID=1962975 RepID=UPI003F9BEBE5